MKSLFMLSVASLSRLMALATPPDGEVLDVGRLAAQDGHDLVGLALELERLEVVGDREQVHLGRQLHRRVAPVAVGEDAELAGLDERS